MMNINKKQRKQRKQNPNINDKKIRKQIREEIQNKSKQLVGNQSKNRITNRQIIQNAPKEGLYKSMMQDPTMAAFARVYTHPWSKLSARMPTFPVTSTQLTRVRVWASGVCNSNGYGFAVCSPGTAVAKDQACVRLSNGPAAPNTLDGTGAATDILVQFSDSEYTSATFLYDPDIGWNCMRPVACGLRVRYVGTNLNKSGLVYTIQNEPRAAHVIGFDVNDIVQRPHKCYSFANTEWHGITRHITDSLDFRWQQFMGDTGVWVYETDDNSQLTLDDYFNMGLLIKAEPGASFEVEFVGHYEIKGKNLHRTGVVPSNTAGLEKTVVNSTMIRQKDNTTPDYQVKPTDGGGFSFGNMVEKIGSDFLGGLLI